MINTKFTYDEGSGDFPTDNDYRRIGLVINPNQYGTTELTSAVTLSATKAGYLLQPLLVSSRLMRLLPSLERLVVTGNCSWSSYFLE